MEEKPTVNLLAKRKSPELSEEAVSYSDSADEVVDDAHQRRLDFALSNKRQTKKAETKTILLEEFVLDP